MSILTWSDEHTRRRMLTLANGTAVVATAIAVGALTARQPLVGLVLAAAILGLGLTVAEPAVIPVLVVPASLVAARAPLGATGISYADVAMGIAVWPALLLGGRPYSVPVRRILWAVAAYEAITLLSLVNTPTRYGAVEWAHQLVLLAGSLVVGWAVGRRGLARLGFGLLVVAALGIATLAVVTAMQAYVHGLFAPAYVTWPYAMHKNLVGTTLGMVAAALLTNPPWLRWPRRVMVVAVVWLLLGVAVAQSRQGIIGFIVVAAVIVFRDPARRRSRGWTALLGGGTLLFVWALVTDQLASNNAFNSANQRVTWFQDSLQLWLSSPWLGLGNRWWYSGLHPNSFQPPNVEIELLTTTGLVGLLAFFTMMGTMLVVLWRLPPAYGMFGFVAVLSRLVQSQFDIFWLTVQSTLPFLLAGLALGAYEYAKPTAGPVKMSPAALRRRRAGAEV